MKIANTFSFFLIFFFLNLSAQSSYVRKISSPDLSNFGMKAFSINESGVFGGATFTTGELSVVTISPNGDLINSFHVGAPYSAEFEFSVGPIYNYRYVQNKHIVSYKTGTIKPQDIFAGLVVLDNDTGAYWTKKLAGDFIFVPRLAVNTNDQIICVRRFWPDDIEDNSGFGLSSLRLADGEENWSTRYRNNDMDSSPILPLATTIGAQNEFYLLGQSFSMTDTFKYTLFRVTPGGELMNTIQISSPVLQFRDVTAGATSKGSIATDNEGNLFIAGRIKISDDINNYGDVGVYRSIIAKFSPSLELIWSKQIVTEEFSTVAIQIAVTTFNEVFFTIATRSNFPVIGGKLNTDGELLEYRGYDFFSPNIQSAEDGSVYMLSWRANFPDATFAKTLPDGSIPSCPQFPACVAIEELEMPVTPSSWYTTPIPPLESYPAIVEPTTYTISDYCDLKAYPEPNFSFPDTLCQGSCAAAEGLSNQLANQVKWQLNGPDIDTLIVDTTFQWCFNLPGIYTIEHQVWVLGCSANQRDTVVVLADNLTPPLGNDAIACDFPYLLETTSSRPLSSVAWSDGSNGPTLLVTAPGNYQVTATDGYCYISDSINITYITDLHPPPLIQVLTDTTLCESTFPFSLHPRSLYTSSFFLDGEAFTDSIRISQAGVYTLSWQLENCDFFEEIKIEAIDCAPHIYLPNVFSPNNDGLNDRIYPQGVNFETVRLQVFDRWGGLVYVANGPASYWDGTSGAKRLASGTYLILLEYQNLDNGQLEQLPQDVLLLR